MKFVPILFICLFTFLSLTNISSAQNYEYSALPPATASEGGSVPVANEGGSPVVTSQSISIPNPLGDKSITDLVQGLLDVVMVFAIPIVVFFIIYAGFMYVTARGNESTIQKAHMALLYALIGGILILGARVLIDVLQGTVDAVIH